MIAIVIASSSLSVSSQEEQNPDEIIGTFTIYVQSMKETKETLNMVQLLEVESLRKESEDFETSIGDFKILIMSREKMEADTKWPKYSLLSK